MTPARTFPGIHGLGAPGIYHAPDLPLRALTGERMDVCAFVGVAPRGPVRVPVVDEKWKDDRPFVEPERPRMRTVACPVESFDEYRRLYGGFEGPGLLPYSVASFFEQGGKRAYIARIVHDYGTAEDGEGVASGVVEGARPAAGESGLTARSEGSWGNRIRAGLRFNTRPLVFDTAGLTSIQLPPDVQISAGTLLRLRLPGGLREFRFVAMVLDRKLVNEDRSFQEATLDMPASAVAIDIDIVEAALLIDDGAGQVERHAALGLSPMHPRWIAQVLCYESVLVYPDSSWINERLWPDDTGLAITEEWSAPFTGGEDRYADIVSDDFFDPRWSPAEEGPSNGVHCIASVGEVATLIVPDLYSPRALEKPKKLNPPVSLAGPDFTICVDLPVAAEPEEPPPPGLDGLFLDPSLPADLAQIETLQAALVDFAEAARSLVVLLDVPPGLTHRQVIRWRGRFRSSYAAAYFPWLLVSQPDDARESLIATPPSGTAAGFIAQSEVQFGVPTGPANLIAQRVVAVEEEISSARHDELHPLGINVYLQERDGVRLMAARTLSRDADLRQLSVRRLMMLLRRTIERQMQWMVFEPNGPLLRADIRQMLRTFLRRLFEAGAFRGANEDEAFFVRCDETNNPPRLSDVGQLVVEIGVAPAEPIEFIVLRLTREGDALVVQETK
jgi:hypothetical protein